MSQSNDQGQSIGLGPELCKLCYGDELTVGLNRMCGPKPTKQVSLYAPVMCSKACESSHIIVDAVERTNQKANAPLMEGI